MQPLKKEATQKVLRLCGSVTEEDQGFTHFVCLSKRSGGSGFQKSFTALWALAKGAHAFHRGMLLIVRYCCCSVAVTFIVESSLQSQCDTKLLLAQASRL